jgi:hypothetical protein
MLRLTKISLPQILPLVAIIGFAILNTQALIGNFRIRLANTSSDDGLVATAYIYKYPDRFQQDVHALNNLSASMSSLMGWIPAVSFKYLNIKPEYFAFLFVYLQNILLGLATYDLTYTLIKKREWSFLVAVFVYYARPYDWNLAAYGDLEWMAYAGYLALPFCLFAISSYIKARFKLTYFSLLLAALIHPSLGFMTNFILGLNVFVNALLEKKNLLHLTKKVLPHIVVLILSMLPMQLLTAGKLIKLNHQDYQLIFNNGHIAPWATLDANFTNAAVTAGYMLISLVILNFAALLQLAKKPTFARFIFISIGGVLILALVHYLAVTYYLDDLYKLILTRATQLLVFILMPYAFLSFSRQIKAQQPTFLFFIVFLLFLGIYKPNIFFAMSLSYLIFQIFALKFSRYLSLWETGFILVMIWLFYRTIAKGFVPDPVLTLYAVVYLVVALTLSKYAKFYPKLVIYGLSLLMMISSLQLSKNIGLAATRGDAVDYFLMQNWVKHNTLEKSLFVVLESPTYRGWRNYTYRPLFNPQEYVNVYVNTTYAAKHNVAFAQFEADYLAAYHNLTRDELYWRELKKRFGVSYLVTKSHTLFAFPIAFKNPSFTLYQIN